MKEIELKGLRERERQREREKEKKRRGEGLEKDEREEKKVARWENEAGGEEGDINELVE